MSREIRSEVFSEADLEPVKSPAKPVVLKSGGPIMDLVCFEGDNGVCEWEGQDGTNQRHLIPLVCLYRCLPYEGDQT